MMSELGTEWRAGVTREVLSACGCESVFVNVSLCVGWGVSMFGCMHAC